MLRKHFIVTSHSWAAYKENLNPKGKLEVFVLLLSKWETLGVKKNVDLQFDINLVFYLNHAIMTICSMYSSK